MPRPITKEDIKRWRELTNWSFRVYQHEKLGWWIKLGERQHIPPLYAYSVNIKDKWPFWVDKKTLEKRKKIGHPKPRRKPKMMRDISMFSFDEIEAAMKVIEELG